MMLPYTPPTFKVEAYHCPHCAAFSTHHWATVHYSVDGSRGVTHDSDIYRVQCRHCNNVSIWYKEQMIFPDRPGTPAPNPDLPDAIKGDYLEAASIVNRSPKGAAALLRLCVQKLCIHLGEPGNNINHDIASLVRKGLNPLVQQSLDAVRVIGNNAVHPGHIDLNDNRELVLSLFHLINLIADAMISQPKRVQTVYNSLPQTALNAIANRP
jgi:hypothetical protein